MPAVACMMAAFYSLLKLIKSECRDQASRDALFLFCFAAFLCHYSGLLFAAGLALTYLVCLMVCPSQRVGLQSTIASLPGFLRCYRGLLLGLILFGGYLLLSSQGSLFVTKNLLATKDPLQLTPYRYLSRFVHSPSQDLGAYLLSTWHAEFNLFAPVSIQSATAALIALFTVLGALIVFASRAAKAKEPHPLRFQALLLPIALALVPCVLGMLGKYPFGGELRQQFFIFPFVIIATTVLLDTLLARFGQRALDAGWSFFIILAALVSISIPVDDTEPGKLPLFRKLSGYLGGDTPLYMGTWTAFTFYGQNRDWDLHFVGRRDDMLTYQLTKGTGSSTIYLDPQVYFSDYVSGDVPAKIKSLMTEQRLSKLLVAGFPLGRMKCRICKKDEAARQLAQALGEDEFEVSVSREKTKNGEGFALISRRDGPP